jgi:hypothetical protein
MYKRTAKLEYSLLAQLHGLAYMPEYGPPRSYPGFAWTVLGLPVSVKLFQLVWDYADQLFTPYLIPAEQEVQCCEIEYCFNINYAVTTVYSAS